MIQISNHPLYRRHNLDSVMGSMWEFYRKRFVVLFIISFVMSLVIQYVSSFVNIQELAAITDPAELLGRIREIMLPILGISLINLLFSVMLQYYVIHNPIDNTSNIFVSMTRSLQYFLPYLIIMILLAFAGSIAMVAGFLLLVIGIVFAVLYIMTVYLFILPVLMIEDAGIGHCIARSFSLAHRNFWTNFGWVTIFLVILIVISFVASGLILLPFTGNFIKSIVNPAEAEEIAGMTTNPLFIVLSALAGAITLPLIPIFSCILYFNARAGEDMVASLPAEEPQEKALRVEDLYAKPYADDHPDNPENKNPAD